MLSGVAKFTTIITTMVVTCKCLEAARDTIDNGRRDLARRLEVGRKREREAHYQAHTRGRGLSRIGNIFI